MTATGTYVYCIVAGTRRPRPPRTRRGLPGLGPVRVLAVTPPDPPPARAARDLPLWAVVADAPLAKYGEKAINRGLTDLDWVSRAAVAHEAVIESFIAAPAVLPMKLFTIFTSDERALAHFARERPQVQTAVKRVKGQHEWGIRVLLDLERAVSPPARPASVRRAPVSGAGYLQRKKAKHDAVAGLARRSREVVADLHDRLSRDATLARRRAASELPAPGTPLLLDAAYLVPRTRSAKFRSSVARQARALVPQGYAVRLSGPWPPYTFMQD
jgi:hypothetical protein